VLQKNQQRFLVADFFATWKHLVQNRQIPMSSLATQKCCQKISNADELQGLKLARKFQKTYT
jgi:hypothetical protein